MAAYARRRSGALQRDPLRLLQPHQRRVAESKSRRIALQCGRRAGKTWTVMLLLLACAQQTPDSVVLYVALTRPSAKQILWRELHRIERVLQLGLRFHETDLEARLPNGSVVALRGANRVDEIEKFRGAHCPALAIDEAASFRPSLLESLVEDVLEPALMDADGTLYLCGTPGPVLAGYFYRVTAFETSGWDVYHWTALDNPALPHAAAWIERQRQEKGWSLDHPTLLREYYGQWVRDDESLVFRYSRERNAIAALPTLQRPGRILSHDYGYVDSTAWCLLAHELGRTGDRHTYVQSSHARTGMAPSEAADETYRLRERYHPHTMVGDAGGLGKGYIEEYRRRHPKAGSIHPADKTRKRAFIELLNDDLRTGRLQLVEPACAGLIEELQTLQWAQPAPGAREDPDDVRDEVVGTNHESDALLYGWRASQAYMNRQPAPPDASDRDEEGVPLVEPRGLAGRHTRARVGSGKGEAPAPWWDRRSGR